MKGRQKYPGLASSLLDLGSVVGEVVRNAMHCFSGWRLLMQLFEGLFPLL
jgi:hypothetical protein